MIMILWALFKSFDSSVDWGLNSLDLVVAGEILSLTTNGNLGNFEIEKFNNTYFRISVIII